MKKMKVTPLELDKEFTLFGGKVLKRVEKVCRSGRYILGDEVKRFEEDFAKWQNAKFSIGVASGSDALLLALMAAGVRCGDEVITTPFSFFASASCIARVGAKPVFVDIDPKTYTINTDLIKRKITPKTKAIIPVHLFGHPCDMSGLKKAIKGRKIGIIEDCAQANGAIHKGRKVGNFGEFGCFSFYPTKNLGAFGDGGAITTNSKVLSDEIRILRDHGAPAKARYHHVKLGINSRLDEIQAAILNIKLQYLNRWIKERNQAVENYNRLIKKYGIDELETPFARKGDTPAFNLYVVRAKKRNALFDFLRNAGIYVGVYYPLPLHLQPSFSFLKHKKGDYPEAERASREVLALPLYPGITPEAQKFVINKVKEFYNQK